VYINNFGFSNVKRASIQYHKLGNEVGIREAKDNLERERAVVDGIVVSSVAMKSVMG
jgi:EKC/KEOPS complex subunit CGI121/TPRKB